MAVVFLIDVSASSGYGSGENTPVDIEKAVAINIIRQLDPEDYVGAIAFRVNAIEIEPLSKLDDIQVKLENKINSLNFKGGSDMNKALVDAEKQLDGFIGEKYVIILTDGVFGVSGGVNKLLAYSAVESMSENDVIIHTVDVDPIDPSPSRKYDDPGTAFMKELANKGNGLYFTLNDYERLAIEFEDKENEEKDQYTIGVYNPYHFITDDLEGFWPPIKDFNGVTEKSVAQVLIINEGKMPILTVWRFGLGRVASLTVDNGNIWAPKVYKYNVDDRKLVSSITNWAIGNLEKRKRVNIETVDVSVGDSVEIRIKSDKEPDIRVQDVKGNALDISLKQTDIDMFTVQFIPQDTGFYMIKAVSSLGEDTDAIAVDTPLEYRIPGVDFDELKAITEITGGKTYNSSQINILKADTLEYAKESSLSDLLEKTPLHIQFMAAALSLFFVDVILRRIKDIIRLRRRDKS